MKVLLQRVRSAKVTVDQSDIASIRQGLLVFVAILKGDNESDIEWMANKVLKHRVFPDEEKPMNRSVLDIDGEILVVSQFTLAATTHRGNRPDFWQAAEPQIAEDLYEKFIEALKAQTARVQAGAFGAYMQVELINDGPVTILLNRDPSS